MNPNNNAKDRMLELIELRKGMSTDSQDFALVTSQINALSVKCMKKSDPKKEDRQEYANVRSVRVQARNSYGGKR